MYYRSSRIWWLVAVMLLVFGFYRGWLAIEGPTREENGKVNVELALDPGKVREDAQQVKQIAKDATDRTLQNLPKLPAQNDKVDAGTP